MQIIYTTRHLLSDYKTFFPWNVAFFTLSDSDISDNFKSVKKTI